MILGVPDRPRHGFTLVELMVVLVLIAVLGGVMLAEMRGTFEDALLRSSARELISVCALASSRAITTHHPHTLVLDPRDGRYAIERMVRDEQFGLPRTVRDVQGGEGQLDQRIRLQIRDPASAPSPEEQSPPASANRKTRPGAITFFPDGTSEPCEILLTDRSGFELSLRLNPVTARLRVFEPAQP